ncbi:hypothetical protein IGK_01399 [Bacillus toyonensis]|nr:hypothetical protein IGK_01399 [Bacillus toyonensis]
MSYLQIVDGEYLTLTSEKPILTLIHIKLFIHIYNN